MLYVLVSDNVVPSLDDVLRVSPSSPSGDVTAVERAASANASSNILEVIHAHSPEEGAACQAVLYEAYQGGFSALS